MARRFFVGFPIFLALAALLAVGLSMLDHGRVLGHLNEVAPDGKVDSYSFFLHERIQENLRISAVVLAIFAVLLFLLRNWLSESFTGEGGVYRFISEVRKLIRDYTKRTSKGHKQMVLLLVTIGIVLRGIMLLQPITYDEALTYTYFATRPVHIIICDHSDPNNHVLNSLLVKLFSSVLGVGKVQVRLPAFLAGVACMPLFYLFVRHMFNRYIALVALALVVSSPRLIEYSALGRGYAISWLCLILALLLGRRLAKENDTVSAILIGIVGAIGMWALPTMIYPVLMIYIWLFLYIWNKYKDSRSVRLQNWSGSIVTFIVVALLLYAPMLIVNGSVSYGRLTAVPERTLEMFSREYGDSALDLWIWFSDPGHFWVSVLSFMGLIFAGYISLKYRFLMAAMILGCVPLVVYQLEVPPPPVWTYTLFMFHLGLAIALYYLLKMIHDNGMPAFSERKRAVLASLVVLIGFGISGMDHLLSDTSRSGAAEAMADKISTSIASQDLIVTQYPWEALVEFAVVANGVDRQVFYNPVPEKGSVYTVVGTTEGQSVSSVLALHGIREKDLPPFELVDDTKGLKTFVARIE